MANYCHQCRYCAYCVYTMEENWWCDELDKFVKNPKRPNKCDKFLFNEIAANNLDKVFKPRKKRLFVQNKLFDIPTDKQKARQK